MRRKIDIILILFCSFLATGCPAILIGAGAGAGVYSYINGELKRTYPADYNDVIKASESALKDLKIDIQSQEPMKDNEAVIKALRSDGTPITVKIHPVGIKLTKVSVRSGKVGFWEKNTSKLIHVTIANKVFQ